MTIVSYAQNYEDVMLWRALKNVRNGFYIDVGANDPEKDSVTKLFYDNGWSGINIEPLKSHFQDLVLARPRDININGAVSNGDGILSIWECEVRGWATVDKSVAATHEENGYLGKWYDIPAYTMKDICEQYCDRSVHFMKVDVEGFEKFVLEGMDFSTCRPWIVVVEATKPNSLEENYTCWESIVLSADYRFAYGDGLNRFYVANEKSELADRLKYPPNIFDDFIKSAQLASELRAQKSEVLSMEARKCVQEAEARVQVAEAKVQELDRKAHFLTGQSQAWESALLAVQKNEEVRAEQAERYRKEAEETLRRIEDQLDQVQKQRDESLSNAHHWYLRATELEVELNSTKDELHNVHQANHQHWTQLQESLGNAHHWYLRATEAEQHHAAAQQRINDLLHSTSWRMTAPLRALRLLIAWLLGLPVRAIKALLRPLLSRVIRFALNRPALRQRLANRLRKYPKVFARLRQFAISRGLVVSPPVPTAATTEPVVTEQAPPATAECSRLDELTPRAKQIYYDLKAAIEKNKEHQ